MPKPEATRFCNATGAKLNTYQLQMGTTLLVEDGADLQLADESMGSAPEVGGEDPLS